MENLILTQLTAFELRQLFREEIESFFKNNSPKKEDTDEIGGIELAMEITGKAKATIYSLCAGRKIPHSKQGKKIYFSRNELLEWIKKGKRKTEYEIAELAGNFNSSR